MVLVDRIEQGDICAHTPKRRNHIRMTEVEDGLVPQRDQSISYFGHTSMHTIASLRNCFKWLGKPPYSDALSFGARGSYVIVSTAECTQVQAVPVHESTCNV